MSWEKCQQKHIPTHLDQLTFFARTAPFLVSLSDVGLNPTMPQKEAGPWRGPATSVPIANRSHCHQGSIATARATGGARQVPRVASATPFFVIFRCSVIQQTIRSSLFNEDLVAVESKHRCTYVSNRDSSTNCDAALRVESRLFNCCHRVESCFCRVYIEKGRSMRSSILDQHEIYLWNAIGVGQFTVPPTLLKTTVPYRPCFSSFVVYL